MTRYFVILLALLAVQRISFGQSVTIGIGSGSSTAGSTITLPITLASAGGAQPAGLQWSFGYSSDITSVTVVAGPSATNAAKSVSCSGNNCLILGFNSTTIADGTVATATFQIASNPSTTSIPIQITGAVASTAAGISIPASGGTGTISLPAPPPSVSVGVSPSSSTLTASQSRLFTATVTGSANTSVTWSMNPSVGTLSNGLYTAPSVINAPQSVIVTATSLADSSKSASATVQLTPTVSIGVSPPNSNLTPSQSTLFTATVTGGANTSVTWSMSPPVGTLSNGFYTAPSVINAPQSVTVTATSVADSTKSASATVQLTPAAGVSVGVSPQSANLTASQTRQFTATVTGNANTSVTWSMSPSVGTLSNGLYTAPSVINTAQWVTITATSVADAIKSASSMVQLTPTASVSVGVSPQSANLTASQTMQFTANVTGNANTSVTWSMSPSVGSLSNGFYMAPSVIKSAQSITITATSLADSSKFASATVQLTPTAVGVSIGVSPLSATLAALQTTQFTATVTGNANTSVTWSMTPAIGTLSNGLYTAPSAISTAQWITITATSIVDVSKSASATVQLVPNGGTGAVGAVIITSPTSQPTFSSSQGTINLGGTAPEHTTQVIWATDQGVQGQAVGTTTWAVNWIALRNGANRITITARDDAGNQSGAAITVVFSAPTIVTTSLPDGQLGKPYSHMLAAVGGTPPFTWSAVSTPNGLTLTEDGLITGTPSTAGTFTLNLKVQDSTQLSATAAIKLHIDNGLVLLSAASLKPGPVAPDSMVTFFGGQLASGAQSATEQPLPTTLGDCTVTVKDANGVERAAGLYYVSPNQINFKIPTDTAAGPATITATSGDQTQTLGNVNIATVSPGLFFVNSDGLAAADLTRVNGDNTSYEAIAQLDNTTNLFVAVPIDLGSDTDKVYLTLYGTGLRNRPSLDSVHVLIANTPLLVDYAGPSTASDGLDLVRVLLPKELRGTGMASVAITVNGISSNSVTILIK